MSSPANLVTKQYETENVVAKIFLAHDFCRTCCKRICL